MDATAANQPVSVHAYADRVVIRQGGEVVGIRPVKAVEISPYA